MTTTPTNTTLAAAVTRRFRDEFGGSSPAMGAVSGEPAPGRGAAAGAGPRVFTAPGRVNLIGAHLDYNGGDVLPLAVDRGVYAAVRLRPDGQIRLRSLDDAHAVDVAVAEVGDEADAAHAWGSYPLGVWHEFSRVTNLRSGFEAVFGGDLPMASGLSSSAAVEISTAVALNALHGSGLEPEQLARIGHLAETRYVGLQCGIMDQYASALGRAGHVLWLHCQEPSFEHVPLDPDAFEVLVLNTRKPRRLAASKFNERVQECAEAHCVLAANTRELPCLARYGMADVEAAGEALSPTLRKRARHVVTEMERVEAGVAGLRRGDVHALGAAMDQSHRSGREDYEVTCDELDVITDAAREVEGVFGARFTGAGFGGCAIALVRPGRVAAVVEHVRERYRARFDVEPGFEVLRAGEGPREIDAAGASLNGAPGADRA